MSFIIATAIKAVLEMDHVDTKRDYPTPGKTTYTFKTSGLSISFQEIKAKILSVFDFPMDIPEDITVTEVKRGPVFKEYLIDIVVDSGKIGKVADLLAKKYGILRRRPYSGEI